MSRENLRIASKLGNVSGRRETVRTFSGSFQLRRSQSMMMGLWSSSEAVTSFVGCTTSPKSALSSPFPPSSPHNRLTLPGCHCTALTPLLPPAPHPGCPKLFPTPVGAPAAYDSAVTSRLLFKSQTTV